MTVNLEKAGGAFATNEPRTLHRREGEMTNEPSFATWGRRGATNEPRARSARRATNEPRAGFRTGGETRDSDEGRQQREKYGTNPRGRSRIANTLCNEAYVATFIESSQSARAFGTRLTLHWTMSIGEILAANTVLGRIVGPAVPAEFQPRRHIRPYANPH